MSKPKFEFRVVCAHFGTHTRHSSHKWNKQNVKKAEQSVIDLNHHREMQDSSFYRNEAPYRIQTREVTAWVDEDKE